MFHTEYTWSHDILLSKKDNTNSLSSFVITVMASQVNWSKILDQRFPSYKLEVTVFLDTLHISKSTDVSIEKIYNVIKDDSNIPDDLKMLYKECIHGSDKNVKLRIHNCVGNFKCGVRRLFFIFSHWWYYIDLGFFEINYFVILLLSRGHPKVREMGMVHTSDYSNLSVEQMDEKIKENKWKDQDFSNKLQLETNLFITLENVSHVSLMHVISLMYSYVCFRKAEMKRKSKLAPKKDLENQDEFDVDDEYATGPKKIKKVIISIIIEWHISSIDL